MSWKIIAIIFIILFIVETILFAGLIYIGTKEISREKDCSLNVCAEADSFQYDSYTQICSCYIDNKLISERYIK